MEKKYIIIGSKECECGYTFDDVVIEDGVQPVYLIDNKYKELLFEMALDKELTDIKDRSAFDRNTEIYKILQEARYMGYDKVTVENSGTTETFTKDEIERISDLCENRIVDINSAIKELRKKVDRLKNDGKPKIVVYTCITGGYDKIKEPTLVTPGIDYICFTDNKEMKSNTWKIRPIPEELLNYSKVKQQRGVKILAHRYLPDYEISIWIDGNVDTKGNINDYLNTLDLDKYSVLIPEHPARKCIYKEKDECVRQRKITGDGLNLANEQMKRYREEKYPENYGLVQTNVMVRRHNDQYCKDLMEKWWSELKDYSHRDQLSFNYALWKVGKDKFKYLIKTTCNSRTFRWAIKHGK